MNCKDLKELLSAYVDGELSRTQREFLEEHVAVCADCKATLEGYRAVNQKLTLLREVPAMPDRKGAIISKIKEEHTRKPTQPWLRPALVVTVVIAVIAALIGVEFLGVGSSEGTGVMMPPPLSLYIRGYTYTLALLAGVLMMAGLAFRSKFARKIAGFMSIVFGGIGVYLGLNALLAVTKSDQSLIMGIIPFFGLIAGTVYLKKQVGQRWMAVAGLAFCLAALVLYIIFLVNYHHWFSWLLLAIAIVIPAGVIGYSFHSEITGVSPRWRRLALVAIPIVAILIALTVLQPWNSFPGPQSVIAKAYAATTELQSYRMSYSSITRDIEGEASKLTTESEFVAPESYYVKLLVDGDVTEFIITGGKQYAKNIDPSRNVSFAVARSSSSFLTKEVTLQMVDDLTDLRELPDEKIDGTHCLHYRGRVDMEKQIEEAKANLDPSNPHDARLLEEVEQLRNWKTEVELWIGKHDYLIRQMKHDWQVPVEDTGRRATSSVTIKYYDFNKPITIGPPVTPSGELLPGWRLIASYPARRAVFLTSRATSTIEGEDPAHQQISYRITITNVGEEVASNVRVTVHTRAINDKSGSVVPEAEPSTQGPIDLGPGESETYNVSWEYDASHTSKEELSRLVDYSRVFTRCTTPEGIEDVQVFSTGAVYPIKSPPTQKLAAQYEQVRQQVDFPINVPTSLPKNLELSHAQVQGMPDGRQMLILLYGDPRAEHIKLSQRRFDIEMAENRGERQKSFEEAGFSRFTIMNISGYWKLGVLCQTDIDDPSTQYWDMSKIQMFWDEGNITYQLTARDVSVEELMLFAASMVKID